MPAMPTVPELVYFLAVEGHAQPRFGSTQFIGARRNRETGRVEWSSEPVAIGKNEHQQYRREYTNAVRRGDLQQVTVEPNEGGGQRVTVLPGGPVPTAKNKVRAANDSFVIGASPGHQHMTQGDGGVQGPKQRAH